MIKFRLTTLSKVTEPAFESRPIPLSLSRLILCLTLFLSLITSPLSSTTLYTFSLIFQTWCFTSNMITIFCMSYHWLYQIHQHSLNSVIAFISRKKNNSPRWRREPKPRIKDKRLLSFLTFSLTPIFIYGSVPTVDKCACYRSLNFFHAKWLFLLLIYCSTLLLKIIYLWAGFHLILSGLMLLSC